MEARSGRTALVEYAAATTTGACRDDNEDAFGIFEGSHVFVIADGCGGRSSGKSAADVTVASFAATPRAGNADDVVDPLALAVLAANASIFQDAQTRPQARGQGAAMCAARLSPRTLSVVHVGDCRVGRCRDGRFEWLTEDHTLLPALRRGGASARELEQAAEFHASVVTRALGVSETLAVDLAHHPLSQGDVYVLCSDGLNTQVPHARISELLLGTSRSLSERCVALLDATEAAGGVDNATLILLGVRAGP